MSSERDEQARAGLLPLDEGERPPALRVAVAVAALLAIGVICLLSLLAGGMYQVRYWAVLGFEALLCFQILVTSLALVVAETIVAAAGCLVAIGLGGWLFWKLVRVMGRIQAGEPDRLR
jgi:hypothetical protein